MTSSENLVKYLESKSKPVKPAKAKDKEVNINSSAKQKELLIKIAKYFGYLE